MGAYVVVRCATWLDMGMWAARLKRMRSRARRVC